MLANEEEEIKLSFLLSGICNAVPSSNYKLQSFLKTHLSNLADKYNVNLPKDFKNRNKTCPYCYTSWNSETTSFKLLPTKKSKFQEKNLKEKDQEKQSRNTLVLKCEVCTNKSLFSLVKNKPVKKIVKEEIVILPKKKKKKKKKDKTCGLKICKINQSGKPASEVSKKKIRQENTNQNKNAYSKVKNPLSNTTQSSKNKPVSKTKPNPVNNKDKKLFPNPFASKPKDKPFQKNDKKLQNLKRAIRGHRINKGVNPVKRTLQNLLKLV